MYTKFCNKPSVRSYIRHLKRSEWSRRKRIRIAYDLPLDTAINLEKLSKYYVQNASDILAQLIDDYVALRNHIISRCSHFKVEFPKNAITPKKNDKITQQSLFNPEDWG